MDTGRLTWKLLILQSLGTILWRKQVSFFFFPLTLIGQSWGQHTLDVLVFLKSMCSKYQRVSKLGWKVAKWSLLEPEILDGYCAHSLAGYLRKVPSCHRVESDQHQGFPYFPYLLKKIEHAHVLLILGWGKIRTHTQDTAEMK